MANSLQPLGVLTISAGVWVAYCGLVGVPPIETARMIITNPSAARAIVDKAKADSAAKYADLFGAAKSATTQYSGGLNPYAAFPITCDWACHKKRGSAGGTDYGMPVGTPVLTPRSGIATVLPNSGAAGNLLRIKFDDGWTIEFMHLSKYLVHTGDKVTAFQPVALSGGAKGAQGAGSSTGPHLHVDMRDPSNKISDYQKYIAGVVDKAVKNSPVPKQRDSYIPTTPDAGKSPYGG